MPSLMDHQRWMREALVEAHEGAIQVQSESGKGSAFTIRLPGSPLFDTGTPGPARGERVDG